MKLPATPWRERAGMRNLLAALDAPQGRTRFVGGCIRDTLLGLPVSDVDLATRLQPDEVMQRLKQAKIRAIPTGISHGTVTAIVDSGPVEVTTLRRDVSTDGRRATVAFTEDWKEDASRRDFTINAFSADPETGEIFDYFDGEADLEERRLRFIGDPLTRIAEDHLRILRFFRFHARFGRGEPDPAGLEACTQRANDLMALSRERIADELLKLLALPDPSPTVAMMVERGIFAPVLPELAGESIARLKELIRREQAADEQPDPLRRLSALLPADASIAASAAARLRLSNKAAKRLVAAAERDDKSIGDPKALAYRIGVEEAVDRLLLGEESPEAVAGKVAQLRSWKPPRLPLTGGEIIAMGLPAGPVVAKTLQAVEREWIERGFVTDKEAVRTLARALVDRALREGA